MTINHISKHDIMRQFFSIATLSCFVVQTYGQVTAGYRILKSPAVTSGTNLHQAKEGDPFSENAVDIEQMQYCERPYLAFPQFFSGFSK